jgi:HSP20 family protein
MAGPARHAGCTAMGTTIFKGDITMNRLIRYTQPGRASLFPAFANRRSWIGFDAEAGGFFAAAFPEFAAAEAPQLPIDLYMDQDNSYVRAALPGVAREAISLEIVDGNLTLSVQRKDGEKSSALTRSVSLPESVQADKVTAAYENGVLTVTLPKQEQAKPRKVNIAVN